MFIPLKMVLIGIDPYPNEVNFAGIQLYWWNPLADLQEPL
jgi:hypothetical protein